jgi:transposase
MTAPGITRGSSAATLTRPSAQRGRAVQGSPTGPSTASRAAVPLTARPREATRAEAGGSRTINPNHPDRPVTDPETGCVKRAPISAKDSDTGHPTAGAGWAPRKRPERQRATFNRRHGTRYVFGAFDVHADRLRVRLRPRRRGSDNLAFMRQIRASYPARKRIYWIQDNLSANWTPEIRAFADANNIELVPTPTYASYLNRIECHFLPISEFVVKNADYLDWDAFASALARHITYRNGPHRDQRLIDLERRRQIAA